MAVRPVFYRIEQAPFYNTEETEFEYYGGFSLQQKKRCVQSLHSSYLKKYPERNVLEISSKSSAEIGINLSAFNLQTVCGNRYISVESAFQGSKVFEGNIQFEDIYNKSSIEAKKDPRIRSSGNLICFRLYGEEFPLNPVTYFYNWLYIKSLYLNKDYCKEVIKYDSFTDIEFNPQRSLNCQAMAAAIFSGLYISGKLVEAMKTKENFLRIVYGSELNADKIGTSDQNQYEQISFF